MQDSSLYLASSSPRRRELLARAGILFAPLVVPVDEEGLTAAYTGPLERLGEYLARKKALAARDYIKAHCMHPGDVLAADTTVLLDGRSLPKPLDSADAVHMLKLLRGREHMVATGVALAPAAPDDGRPPDAPTVISATSTTRVRMRDYGDEEIAAYVATGDPLDKAGAYSLQHPNFSPVVAIAGCRLGVIGLPVCIVARLLGRGTLPPTVPLATHRPKGARHAEGARHAPLPTHGALCVWSPGCTPPLPTEAVLNPDNAHEAPA